MGKKLSIIVIILSLGSAGCAGVGVQQGSNLGTAHPQRGLDALWSSGNQEPAHGSERPTYAEQGLGALWSSGQSESSFVQGDPQVRRRGADLWNTSPSTRSWDSDETPMSVQPSPRLSSARGRRGSRHPVAQ